MAHRIPIFMVTSPTAIIRPVLAPIYPDGYEVRTVRGNLFTSGDNLCRCVSADMHMDKWGVPAHKYDNGTISKAYSWQVGDVGIIQDEGRYILYLVTKDKYWGKPTYESLRRCLSKLSSLGTLSMPKIGCGLDRLLWPRVSTLITDTLPDVGITVYVL